MYWHWQNLNDSEPKRHWLAGRAWFARSAGRAKSCTSLNVEWTVRNGGCHWGMTFGGGDSGRNLGVCVAIPWLLTLYVTLENVFPSGWFDWSFEQGHSREIGCYFFDWTFHYSIWVGSMASWSRSDPWCRWWRQGSFDFRSLLGKQTYHCETLKDGIRVVIPMPEGVYHGTAKIERRTWKRRFWFAHSRVSTTIDCPKGIPHAGKGENSWDCGDDGLFGWGAEGPSVEKAIAHGVEVVLTSRRRYGQPSPKAIAEALPAPF